MNGNFVAVLLFFAVLFGGASWAGVWLIRNQPEHNEALYELPFVIFQSLNLLFLLVWAFAWVTEFFPWDVLVFLALHFAILRYGIKCWKKYAVGANLLRKLRI